MRWLSLSFSSRSGRCWLRLRVLARHIWLQRAKPGSEQSAALGPAEEPDLEVKP